MLEDKPLVSVVITTYKRSPEIVGRALKSVVRQTYSNLEIFVVNDYPDDAEMAEALGKTIKRIAGKRNAHYIVVEHNGGACKARNLALTQAQGKYIACLDDDDEWLPQKVQLQVEKLEANPTAAIAYCNAELHYEGNEPDRNSFLVPQQEGNIYFKMIGKNIIGSCSFPMFRMKVLKEVRGFNEDMPALQDWELYLRILKHHEAVYIDKPLAIYYFYDGERISTHSDRRTIAYEKVRKLINDDLKLDKKAASSFYLMGTYFYSLNGEMCQAFRYYCRGVRCNPFNLKRNTKDFLRMTLRKFVKTKHV